MTRPPQRNHQSVSPPPPAAEPEPTPKAPSEVVAHGMNGAEAIARILGEKPNRVSGDPLADVKAALHAIEDFRSALPFVRALLLHVAHSQLYPRGGNGDTWLGVALALGYAKSTIYDWAHPTGWMQEL